MRRYTIINQRVETRFEAHRVAEVKRRFLQLNGCMCIEEFLRGWFHGVPYESIRRGNVEDFVAYGFYCRTMDTLPPRLQAATKIFVRQMEAEWGATFPEGRNPDISFMAHIWEDLRVLPKPLALHLASEAANLAGHAVLRCMGFRKDCCQGFTYWIRQPSRAPRPALADSPPPTPTRSRSRRTTPTVSPMTSPSVSPHTSDDTEIDPTSLSRSAGLLRQKSIIHRRGDSFSSLRSDEGEDNAEEEPRPIFFLHGVGLGLVPYLGLIQQTMWACPDSPMILLEAPHVGLRLQMRSRSVDDVAHAAAQILWRHTYEGACFVAHSYGTFCVSRICQLHRSLVHSVALIDPVCFLTCYPQLLYNFVYRVPKLADVLGSLTGMLGAARFLFSRDLIIAETFCRKFLWHELMLWPEDMPPHALVILSDADDLVPSALVAKHISDAHTTATVMYHPTAGHGGFLVDLPWQRQMVQGIKALALLPEDASRVAFPGSPAGKLLEGAKTGSMRYNSLGAFSSLASLSSLARYHSLTSRS
ncbi:g4771 [Coccomyxa elongata]